MGRHAALRPVAPGSQVASWRPPSSPPRGRARAARMPMTVSAPEVCADGETAGRARRHGSGSPGDRGVDEVTTGRARVPVGGGSSRAARPRWWREPGAHGIREQFPPAPSAWATSRAPASASSPRGVSPGPPRPTPPAFDPSWVPQVAALRPPGTRLRRRRRGCRSASHPLSSAVAPPRSARDGCSVVAALATTAAPNRGERSGGHGPGARCGRPTTSSAGQPPGRRRPDDTARHPPGSTCVAGGRHPHDASAAGSASRTAIGERHGIRVTTGSTRAVHRQVHRVPVAATTVADRVPDDRAARVETAAGARRDGVGPRSMRQTLSRGLD